ncbi:hypothetical protein DRE_02147 [Drechslerella stenobrocha 248]|uniref:Uncharacterized protein n=1 Tax=Drechslerella stenobrocha 248 TaxID=1043628 RepID=W7I7R7_9PEZI|nr:hypothetical protein DRE_02147 [Drechslerella stenobrocha 248]
MPVSMPQFRFPFSRKAQPQPAAPAEEPTPDVVAPAPSLEDSTPRSHRREKSTGSISIISRRSREEDNNTYKLSVVNDSGIYLPPSPVEKKGFWGKRESVDGAPQETPDIQDIGFAITRESFDSYRRSFDISARTQLSDSLRHSPQSSRSSFDDMPWGRQSLDATPNRLPSIDVSESASEDEEEEEVFRDVDLTENALSEKKKGFLGRFVPGNATDEDCKGRLRSSTAIWRREHNRDAEELSAMVKGSNHLIAV